MFLCLEEIRYDVFNIILVLVCFDYDDLYFMFYFQDDFEMMKDVDVLGDFVFNEEDMLMNIKEKEVK